MQYSEDIFKVLDNSEEFTQKYRKCSYNLFLLLYITVHITLKQYTHLIIMYILYFTMYNYRICLRDKSYVQCSILLCTTLHIILLFRLSDLIYLFKKQNQIKYNLINSLKH